jgi:threonine synthase
VKNEGQNPTGSFKDRGMTVGVTRAWDRGTRVVLCASTGNTAASLAAYAARAGLRCVVVIPAGKIAQGKLAQAVAYGAEVVQVQANFDTALQLVLRVAASRPEVYLLNSINPYRGEGQKTLAYELYEELPTPPDIVVVPVGNAGNISAIWKGFRELRTLGFLRRLPRLLGVQAQGAAPIAEAFMRGSNAIQGVAEPQTIATAIRIGAPVSWRKALRALRESDGHAVTVSDKAIGQAQEELAGTEGLFVEPASAATLAGLRVAVRHGWVPKRARVVCVATGHGLKDPEAVARYVERVPTITPSLPELDRVLRP